MTDPSRAWDGDPAARGPADGTTAPGPRDPDPRRRDGPIDPVDRQILAELTRDSRLSMRALADRVHISRTAAHSRVTHLVERGVIEGFTVRLDRAAVGLPVGAVVIVQIGGDQPWPSVLDALVAVPYVDSVQAVSGDIDFLVSVSAPDHRHLSEVVLQRIRAVPGVLATRTHVVLRTVGSGDDPPAPAP